MIKVLQERRVRRQNYTKLVDHILELRAATLHQPGYISGETLVKGKDPVDVMTISAWISEDHWKSWITSEQRISLNDVIESIIEGESKVSIYTLPFLED